MSAEWDEKQVFLEALRLPADQLDAFLRERCPDEAAQDRIRILLRHHSEAPEDFLDASADVSGVAPAAPKQVDEFRILHRLGKGGMGVVYLAEDTILGRRVALKVLASHLTGSEQALARFREEARSAASLKHPAIVPVFKFGRDRDQHYLVSEFVEGRTLADLIAEKRRAIDEGGTGDLREWHRRAAEIVATVADALDNAHRARIVHRDVKPSNIMIDRDHGPRLMDFGIAKYLAEEDRTETRLIGSCHYMSPEQADIAGTRVDQRSDIFSLGVVLYEMLSLRRPFEGATIHQVMRAVIESSPPNLHALDRRIARDLETICHKSLEKQPSDRYQTAAHVAADLRCFLAGDPILAKPPTLAHRVRRFVQRRRAFLGVACVAIAMSAVVGALWHQRVQRNARLSEVAVSMPSQTATLWIRKVDTHSWLIGAPREWGTLPANVYLEPGLYRFLAKDATSNISESSVLITRPGQRLTVHIRPTSTQRRSGMVHFKGEELQAGPDPKAPPPKDVDPFFIDDAEVSNAEYEQFLKATGAEPPPHWALDGYTDELAEYPVVAISWSDANAYCGFYGMRLPSEAEWEYAMRWPDGRLLPWLESSPPTLPEISGDSFERVSSGSLTLAFDEYSKNTTPVYSIGQARTAAGIYHAATNVREFTENVLFSETMQVIIKGGSWLDSRRYITLASRKTHPLESRDSDGTQRRLGSTTIGFRCACSGQP